VNDIRMQASGGIIKAIRRNVAFYHRP